MEMDSDFSHDPADIPRLLKGIDEGADLVIGSRYVPGGEIPHWPWHRRALSKYGNRYSAAMLRVNVRDVPAGHRAYRTDVGARIDIDPVRAEGYGLKVVLTSRVPAGGARGAAATVPASARHAREPPAALASFASSRRLSPLTRATTASPSTANTSDLTICPRSTPIAMAASAADRVPSANSRGWMSRPRTLPA